MAHPIKWLGFWLLLAGALWLFGCASEAPETAPLRGAGDAGAADLQVVQEVQVVQADAVPTAPDTTPATPDVLVPVPDTRPAIDTTPALTCEKIGAWSSTTTARMIPVEPTAYCFTICPAIEPSSPLDYAWTCMGFTDVDRTITVNGQQVSCGRALPATVNGAWTFMLAPGGHTNDFINWTSPLRACP